MQPESPVFTGEAVTFTWAVKYYIGWQYKWFKRNTRVELSPSERYSKSGNVFIIRGAAGEDSALYWTKAVLTLEPNWTPIFTGESVSLTCSTEGEHGSTYYRWEKTDKDSGRADEIRGWERNKMYNISKATETDSGSYTCITSPSHSRSNPVSLTVADFPTPKVTIKSPEAPFYPGDKVTLSCDIAEQATWAQYFWYRDRVLIGKSTPLISSDRPSPVFTGNTVTLRCGMGQSTGWRFYWYRDTQTSDPVAQTGGDSYSIRSVRVSDGGQYWCRAGRGDPVYITEYSNAVWVNVTDDHVILESPVHPVTEGDPLTLRCRYRHKPSNISAEFYKDGTLLHTSSTGEMTIPAVSKAHEGLYKCSNPERGESPESWVTVRVSKTHAVSADLITVGAVVGVIVIFALGTILLLMYCYKKRKGGTRTQTPLPGPQGFNTNQNPDQGQHGYQALPAGTVNVYDTINTAEQNVEDGATAGLGDVTYATIDQNSREKPKKRKNRGKPEPGVVYSELQPVKTTGEREDGQGDITYAQVTAKTKKGAKAKRKEPKVDDVYSEVKCSNTTGF
ncbi:hypothetical protein ACEWY4_024943 [Coilia grayii]|uniref:Ig-like domain-containing protein n=1 Tax=Coilia grayii TaxID=363190 RepID=A0ABD1IW67_9TELE